MLKTRSEASRQKIISRYFEATLRFAPLASLSSAILSEIKVNNLLVDKPAGVINQKVAQIRKYKKKLFLDFIFEFY